MTAHYSWRALPAETEAEQLELFYAHLTLRSCPDEAALIPELLAQLPLRASTRAHLGKQDASRLLIYRTLTRATHRRVLQSAFPRAAARMGKSFDDRFDAFLDAHGTTSHFLRDLVPGFLEFCEADVQGLPLYVLELARLEAVRLEVAAAPDATEPIDLELDLNRGLIFSEAVRVLSFHYAVHQLPDSIEDETIPEERPTHLLSYRSADNQVVYMELSRLAAGVIGNLLAAQALGASIRRACDAAHEELTDQVLAGTAQLLSDLSTRRVIIGVAP